MTYVELMKTLRICSVGNSTDCDACPLHSSHDCHTIMARNALAELERQEKALIMQEKKMSELAKKYDPIEIVKTALVKGGYSVTVTPDGEVRMMPWDSTQWISMRDEQPDHDGKYLTFHGLTVTEDWFKSESLDMLVGVCNWYKVKGGWYSLEFEKPVKTVTHWMELPTAPEGWG